MPEELTPALMANAKENTQVSQETVLRFAVDSRASRFTIRAFASGLLSAFGHNPAIAIRDISGEARLDIAQIENSSLRLVIRTDSLSVMNDVSDKDRREIEQEMRQSVLETARFPEIVYDCSRLSVDAAEDGQYNVVLHGTLTMHGVSRAQGVPVKISTLGEMLRAFGEFSLRQSDYNIKPVSAVGGALKVKDELKASFDIVARSRAQEQGDTAA